MFTSQRLLVKPWHAGVRTEPTMPTATRRQQSLQDLGPKAPTPGGSTVASTALAAIGTGLTLRGPACRGDGQESSSSAYTSPFPKTNSLGSLKDVLTSCKGALSRPVRKEGVSANEQDGSSGGITGNEQAKQCGSSSGGAGATSKRTGYWHRLQRKRRRWDLQRRKETRSSCRNRDGGTDDAAIEEMERDIYTAASKRSSTARLAWWRIRADARSIQPYPITKNKLTLMAALLKKGRYRSAQQYLYTVKKEHSRLGHSWDSELDERMADARRSCARGLGGSQQADPLLLEAAWTCGYEGVHVADAVAAVTVGSWFMLREIEVANIRIGDVAFEAGPGCGSVVLEIPVSKADWRARGCKRRLSCTCPAVSPVKAAQILMAKTAGRSAGDAVVTAVAGGAVSKVAMVKEIASLANAAGAPPGNYTGHSLRTTGAQHMALAGVAVEKIRVFRRWASNQMLRYTREALIDRLGTETASEMGLPKGSAAAEAQAAGVSKGRVVVGVAGSTAKAWQRLKLRKRG